ncbi:MAG: magnesium transporter [Pseudomonadota bacterium]
MEAREYTQANLDLLREQLEGGRMRAARVMVNSLHPSEVARLLESLPLKKRAMLWEIVDHDIEGDVLVEVADEVRDGLLEDMGTDELVAAVDGMEVDDLADLLVDLPEAVTKEVLQSLDKQDQELFLSRLLTNDPDEMVANVMSTDVMPIPANTPESEVVWEFENRDLLSAPVVDDNYRVLGRITVDDVVDVIRDEAEHSLMSAAGLDEEDDMFAPVVKSASRRAIWLGINLFTAFLAAAVVDQFQSAIDKVVLLAVLMPVVPSMGGVAGTQSLVIITRAIALGQINPGNAMGILRKEVMVGVLNGIGWAIFVAILTFWWFGNWHIGGILGAAMIINLVVAAAAGFGIPLALKKLRVDPALAGGVVLTTVTDVVGYMAFLGLGAIYLL